MQYLDFLLGFSAFVNNISPQILMLLDCQTYEFNGWCFREQKIVKWWDNKQLNIKYVDYLFEAFCLEFWNLLAIIGENSQKFEISDRYIYKGAEKYVIYGFCWK